MHFPRERVFHEDSRNQIRLIGVTATSQASLSCRFIVFFLFFFQCRILLPGKTKTKYITFWTCSRTHNCISCQAVCLHISQHQSTLCNKTAAFRGVTPHRENCCFRPPHFTTLKMDTAPKSPAPSQKKKKQIRRPTNLQKQNRKLQHFRT
jgi:hypothetical protein